MPDRTRAVRRATRELAARLWSRVRRTRDGTRIQALEDLHEELLRRRREVIAGDAPEVAKALRWLGRCQRDDGFWSEEDNEAATALCALAVHGWSAADSESEDAMAAAREIDLERTASWLEGRARRGFATAWYTAVNLQALCALGRADSAGAVALARSLDALNPEDEQYWLGRGHHAAQILNALRAHGADSAVRERWRNAIVLRLGPTNDTYVEGQMAHALLEDNVASSDLQESVDRMAEYLENHTLSQASFTDYVPALLALSVIAPSTDKIARLVREKTGELIRKYGETRWYHEPTLAAWALLAVRRSAALVEVAVDVSTLNQAFATLKRRLPAEQRRVRRRVAGYAALLGVEAAVAVFLTFENPTSFLVTSLVVGIGLAATVPLIVKQLLADLR